MAWHWHDENVDEKANEEQIDEKHKSCQFCPADDGFDEEDNTDNGDEENRKTMTLQKTQKVGSFFPLRLIGLLPRNPEGATINQSMSSNNLASKAVFKNNFVSKKTERMVSK